MKKILFAASILVSVTFTISADLFHPLNLVKTEGSTVAERIETPHKFKRIKIKPKSFADFLRNYPLKEPGSPVLLYNGNEKQNQEAHAAIFALPLEKNGTQQSAQSIIRLYSEYMYKYDFENELVFHLTNGEICNWTEWLEKSESKRNLRTEVASNLKKWTKYEKPADRNEIFHAFLKKIFANTSPLSIMEYESVPTDFSKLEIGDILFDLGKPTQICLVVDICINPDSGEKAVLLAQSNSPAQDFYIIKNPKRVNDPWYHEEDFYVPAQTPEYIFPKESWRHVNYLDNNYR